jgi:hypothetical protein
MERSGGRRALLRGEGLPNAQPREREFHGGHRGAEPVGGGAFLLRDGLLGFTLTVTRGYVLGGVGGCGGCGGHVFPRALQYPMKAKTSVRVCFGWAMPLWGQGRLEIDYLSTREVGSLTWADEG